jgi:hypothetical protein
MSKITYRTVLRAKGIRPIPHVTKLRSSLLERDPVVIDATRSAQAERAA